VHLKGNRIGAYARDSSDKQNVSSVDDQLRRFRTALAPIGSGLTPALTFTDHAISGKSTDRPGFEALMERVKRRELDVLLVEDVSRLARNQSDATRLYEELAYQGRRPASRRESHRRPWRACRRLGARRELAPRSGDGRARSGVERRCPADAGPLRRRRPMLHALVSERRLLHTAHRLLHDRHRLLRRPLRLDVRRLAVLLDVRRQLRLRLRLL
jgi:Resolvase, N terminal domain